MKSEVRLDFVDLLGETRWLGDFMSWTLDGPFHRALPNAQVREHGVLLIPGFLSGDYSLSPLAARLEALGYRTFFSGIWYNVDCPFHTLPRLEKVLRKANYKTQCRDLHGLVLTRQDRVARHSGRPARDRLRLD